MVFEKHMADIVEVADQRHIVAHFAEPVANMGHRRCRFGPVDGDSHELRPRLMKFGNLPAVASTSAVSVLVMDWTAMECVSADDIDPTLTAVDFRRCLAAENAILPSQVAETIVPIRCDALGAIPNPPYA